MATATNTIMLYSGIYSFTAEEFIEKLNSIPKDEDVLVRLNSPGGSVFAGWGMIAAITEREGKTTVKVDGNAASMAFFLTLFFDNVEALDVTGFMIHKATAYIETEDDRKMLTMANTALRDKLKARVNEVEFERVTGISVDQLFDGDIRRDIWLTAKEAKQIGLVDKVVRLEPREIEAMQDKLVAFAEFNAVEGVDSHGSDEGGSTGTDRNNVEQKNEKVMTIEEFKTSNPELYAQILQDGVNQERDRVMALMTFVEIDAKTVKEAIEKGEGLTQKFQAEMLNKSISKNVLKDVEDESPKDVNDPDKTGDDDPNTPKDEKEKEEEKRKSKLAEAKKEIFAAAGLKIEEEK